MANSKNGFLERNGESEEDLEAAFLRVLPDIEGLPSASLIHINLDIWATLMTVEGVLPELAGFRPRFEKELPGFDLRAFDRLGDYARAAAYAHSRRSANREGKDVLRELQERGVALREVLLADLKTLTLRGLLPPDRLALLQGSVGYKNLVNDLQVLVSTLKENWPKIAGKCATSEEELREGARLVMEITRTIGLREQGPPVEAVATNEQRARAFSLLVRTYEVTRRAVAYLRADDKDVDDIIPSLYATRSAGRKKNGGEEVADDVSAGVTTAAPVEASPVPPSAKPTIPNGTSPFLTLTGGKDGGPFLS